MKLHKAKQLYPLVIYGSAVCKMQTAHSCPSLYMRTVSVNASCHLEILN